MERRSVDINPPGSRTAHDHGATSVEYALLITLIAAVIVGSVLLFGQAVGTLFDLTP